GVDLFEHSDRARQLRDRRARPGHVAAAVVRRGQASARRHRRPADGVDAQQRDRRTNQVVRGACLTGISAQVGGRDMTNEIGINQLKRRDFLRAGLVFGAGAAGLAAGYAAVPDAFARPVYADARWRLPTTRTVIRSPAARAAPPTCPEPSATCRPR